jgi:hypothetical protein
MRSKPAHTHVFVLALALTGLSSTLAYGADDASAPGQPAAAAAPNPNSEIFKTLRARCETDAPCGKTSGDVCADAAAILLGTEPPDEFREMSETQRVKIALRLLEKGVDSSNLAAGRAYDLYGKSDFLLGLTSGAYADPYRANELMEMMSRRSYPGAALRKARATVSFFSMTVGDAEKRQGCALAALMKAGGKLDADSAKIADQVLESNYCVSLNQAPRSQ